LGLSLVLIVLVDRLLDPADVLGHLIHRVLHGVDLRQGLARKLDSLLGIDDGLGNLRLARQANVER
jgi:hypothetical protein